MSDWHHHQKSALPMHMDDLLRDIKEHCPGLLPLVKELLQKPAWWNPSNHAWPSVVTVHTSVNLMVSGLSKFVNALRMETWNGYSLLGRMVACLLTTLATLQAVSGRSLHLSALPATLKLVRRFRKIVRGAYFGSDSA